MNDLSHDARSLLAEARNASGLPGPRRQRIKRAVLLRVAAVTAASAGTAVAGATSLAGKVVITSVLATMATGGVVGVWRWRASVEMPALERGARAPSGAHERPRRMPPAPLPPGQAEPEARPATSPLGLGQPAVPTTRQTTRSPAPTTRLSERGERPRAVAVIDIDIERPEPTMPPPTPVAVLPTAVEPPSVQAQPQPSASMPGLPAPVPVPTSFVGANAPSGHVPSSGAHPGVTGPTTSIPGTLVREVALLERAHQALRDGQPQLALGVLRDYELEFPRGSLREEHRAIAAIATCKAQPGQEARARARAFLRASPSSLLADGVRAACLPPTPPAE